MEALLFTYIFVCALCDLQKVPFNCRDVAGQLEIVRMGRPTPDMKHLTSSNNKSGYTRHFQPKLYDEHTWLAGCPIRNKLFCWPCTVFVKKVGTRRWTHDGFSDLNNLHLAIGRHQKSEHHIGANLSLREFGKSRENLVLDKQKRESVKQRNAIADKNRKILERFVDVACHLATQEMGFRRHDGNSESECRRNFDALVKLLAKYDLTLAKHVEDPTALETISATLQNDLVEAISVVVANAIQDEVKGAPFVSVVLMETPDISQVPHLSTVLRYISPRGDIVERFLHFNNLGGTWNPETLSTHLLDVLGPHKLDTKIVSQTYDCTSIAAEELSSIQARVRLEYPSAIPVHYTTHHLNLVLTESVKSVVRCGVFFMTLGGLATFFSRSSRRVTLLEKMIKGRLQHVDQSAWNFHSRLVHTVKENRTQLIELFSNILENVDGWDEEAICCAQGFIASLSCFVTVFLLNIFADIFDETTGLFDVLQTEKYDVAFCKAQVENVRLSLLTKRDSFDDYYEATEQVAGKSAVFSDHCPPDTETREATSRMYLEIIDNIVAHLTVRFENLDDLQFLRLLDATKFAEFATQFPTDALDNLISIYPAHFDSNILKSELSVLYNRESYRSLASVRDFYDYIVGMDLGEAIPETFTLCKLVLTLQPSTADEGEQRESSVLKRIKSFTMNATDQEKLSGLPLISIERGLLAQLQADDSGFQKLVIDEFAKKEARIALLYN